MLKSLSIVNFKRFRKLEFPQLKRVNFITGKNNTAKTGLLEAVLLLLDPQTGLGQLPNAFRNCDNIGDLAQNFSKWLFNDRDTSHHVTISTTND